MAEFRHNRENLERATRLFNAFMQANPFAERHPYQMDIDWIHNKDGYRSGDQLRKAWDQAVRTTTKYRSSLNVFDHQEGFLVPNKSSQRRHRIVAAKPGGHKEQWTSPEFQELLTQFGLAAKYGGIERSWYSSTTHLIVVGKPEAIKDINVSYNPF